MLAHSLGCSARTIVRHLPIRMRNAARRLHRARLAGLLAEKRFHVAMEAAA
jgi:hypothetical protein